MIVCNNCGANLPDTDFATQMICWKCGRIHASIVAQVGEEFKKMRSERDQLRAEVAGLRRHRTELDCRYTLGDVADISGSHCPLNSKCTRCKAEDAELQVRDLEKIRDCAAELRKHFEVDTRPDGIWIIIPHDKADAFRKACIELDFAFASKKGVTE